MAALRSPSLFKLEPPADLKVDLSIPPIVIDTREQRPFVFHASIRTVARALPAGDYSLEAHESVLAVERKSLSDFVGSISRDRDRFFRELEKLKGYEFAAIVIEGSTLDVWKRRYRQDVAPESVIGTAAAIHVRFGIACLFADSPIYAGDMTLRLLRNFYRIKVLGPANAAKAAAKLEANAGGNK